MPGGSVVDGRFGWGLGRVGAVRVSIACPGSRWRLLTWVAVPGRGRGIGRELQQRLDLCLWSLARWVVWFTHTRIR